MRRPLRLARMCAGATWDRVEELALRMRLGPRALLHHDARVTPATLALAVAKGSAFLAARQAPDGVLRGFALFPGASTSWVTAHVALTCDAVPQLTALCEQAAAHLLSTGAVDGGWGYNRRVGVDCDSTAQALLVLQRFALPCAPFLFESLASAQHPCGGFPTYRGDGSRPDAHASGWHAAHPDVSLFAAEALSRAGGFDAQVERCGRWLADSMREGVVPSYWWSDDCYALWAQQRTGRLPRLAAGRVRAALAAHRSAPQLAMALEAAVALGVHDDLLREAAGTLLHMQLSDGSWPCAPCLRVTSATERRPGRDARGRVVRDRRRVFSTAHAVAALSAVSARRLAEGATAPGRAARSPS